MAHAATAENKEAKKIISKPLLLQSIKANWLFWLVLTIGSAAIFIVVNIVIGSKSYFTNIDMNKVAIYVQDEWPDDPFAWQKVLGLLQTMGFKLSRIKVMSQIDMNSILNDLIYKIAGVLLPMIYVMVVANKLVASQVSDGSMAYVLSTPTGRKKVLSTQFLFLFLSILAMYIVILAAALGSEAIANAIKLSSNPNANTNPPLKATLYTIASFLAIFALGGIAFGASCWFNKTNKALAVGGGVCVISFICCILGLFGNKVFVAVGVGVEAMNVFNYFSIFTLIDTESMTNFVKNVLGNPDVAISYDWVWKYAIMAGIALLGALIGSIKFVKKDLPL